MLQAKSDLHLRPLRPYSRNEFTGAPRPEFASLNLEEHMEHSHTGHKGGPDVRRRCEAARRCWVTSVVKMLVLFLCTTAQAQSQMGAGRTPGAAERETVSQPNILVFFVDDLGWADTEPYGSTFYETPNVSRLAEEGMQFMQAYAHPLCSPSRAALLTGKYPARLRMTKAITSREVITDPSVPNRDRSRFTVTEPQQRTFLPLGERTVAEALREGGGYNTYHLGKWHLSPNGRWPKWAKYSPHHQGFEHVVGVGGPGPGTYFSPYGIPLLPDGPPGEYLTDRLSREAVALLEKEKVKEGPFFMYLAHHNVHGPWQGEEELVAKYARKLRRKDDFGHQMNPINAAKVESIDRSLGRIIEALEQTGMASNTVLVFTSDNGGVVHVKNPVPATSNHPLRNGKASIYEGGVRVPMIVRWPGEVRAGVKNETITHIVDLYPTFLGLAGVNPDQHKLLDGESLLPVLKRTGELNREAVYHHFPHYLRATGNSPATSVHSGRYKLIRFYGAGPGQTDRYELYDLQEDVSEANNIAEHRPEKVEELKNLMEAWLRDTNALLPKKNPNYNPEASSWSRQ